MKKILLSATLLLFITIAYAQPKRTKDYLNGGDTTWNSSGPTKRMKITNGNVKVHTVHGKYDLYATYKNKKVTGYYAIDAKGNKLPVSVVAKTVAGSSGKFKCYTCAKVCNEAGKCAEDCTEIECPDGMGVEKATTAERPKPEDPDQGGEIFKKPGKKAKKATKKAAQ